MTVRAFCVCSFYANSIIRALAGITWHLVSHDAELEFEAVRRAGRELTSSHTGVAGMILQAPSTALLADHRSCLERSSSVYDGIRCLEVSQQS